MRICVFGAGAVGGHLAARLAASGHEVAVVARGAHLEAMRAHGVRLIHGDEIIRAKVNTAPAGAQDAVLVTLKANLLGVFAGAAAPLLGPDTLVVFAQNGIPWWYAPRRDERLKSVVPMHNIAGGVIYSANEVVEPGVIRNFVPNNNMLVIGSPDRRDSQRLRDLRAALEKSGMSSPAPEDIRQSVWAKLAQNIGNSSLCLLAERAISDLVADPELRELNRRAKAEAASIASALGIDIARAPQRPSGGQASGAIGHKPSLLQDYERGRPMEIEALLLAPHAMARAAGVATPTLDVLIPLAAHKAAAKGLYQP
jgi:2-dehydropantoate 2-reductase